MHKAFTVSMGTKDQVTACDYVGLVSGKKAPDKFAKAGFHATKSSFVDAPCIDELPLTLECKVKSCQLPATKVAGLSRASLRLASVHMY